MGKRIHGEANIKTTTPPAAKALAISPENFIPPSAIKVHLLFPIPFLTLKIALSWGTPIPATNPVVQIDPGPIPTLIISTPNLIKYFAASAVATDQNQAVRILKYVLEGSLK